MKTREYLDFVVRVDRGSGETYPVTLVASPAGEASAMVRIPVQSEDLQRRLRIVEAARGGALSRGGSLASCQADSFGLSNTEQLGQDLFRALMSGDIHTCFQNSLEKARNDGKGLRLRLRVQAPELAALPWEYLVDYGRKPVALSPQTPLVRHLEMPLAASRLRLQPPVRILGMIGSSTGLDVPSEQQSMERAIEHLVRAGTVSLTWIQGHTWRDLQTALREPWHVFHFIGHGAFDPEDGMGQILLRPEEGGEGAEDDRLAAPDLARMLGANPSLRLVVLNSCEGARASQTDLLSSTGAVLAAEGIPAVVSMQYEISDRAALEFSRQFYDSLAAGMPVEAAVSEARNSIKLTLGETVEWGTPVLHMRSSDGLLFELDNSGALFPPRASEPRPAPPPPPPPKSRFGIESLIVPGGRSVLMGKVDAAWIEGVLRKKLEQSARLSVGLEMMAGEVNNPFGELAQGLVDTPEGTAAPAGCTPAALLDEFGSLLILGEPGSGKTVALLEIARDRLTLAGQDKSAPVPVVFNLSSWAMKKGALTDWMVAELTTKYQIPRGTGETWLRQGKVLPLLDGLDEVAADARAECAEAINSWLETALTGVVVCCRFLEYRELPAKLNLNGALRLQPLTTEQIFAFVESGGEPLAGLRRLLESDSGLLIDARTPLMIALMAIAFRGIPAASLGSLADQDLAARRDRVMDLFVKREFQRAREGGSLV